MKKYLKLFRVHQWVKNTFMFLPLFFAGELFNFSYAMELIFGFVTFSLIASAIYIINDYKDIEQDRLHERKRLRPLASGAVEPSSALILAAIFVVLSLGSAYLIKPAYMAILLGYFILNIFYSLKLKHIPILDITIIAVGFLLRVFGGGVIADIPISRWLILMTFLLALFLGLAKRRDDVFIYLDSGNRMRKAIDGYNLEFINASMIVMSSVMVVAYIMYTVSEDVLNRMGDDHLYMTTLFVILGLLRYWQISLVENNSGSPTKVLLKDRFIQLTVLGWILAFYFFIYL